MEHPGTEIPDQASISQLRSADQVEADSGNQEGQGTSPHQQLEDSSGLKPSIPSGGRGAGEGEEGAEHYKGQGQGNRNSQQLIRKRKIQEKIDHSSPPQAVPLLTHFSKEGELGRSCISVRRYRRPVNSLALSRLREIDLVAYPSR